MVPSHAVIADADTRRANLDQEIYALQLRLSDLRSQRNTLAPISSLPTDLLALLFKATNEGPSVANNSANIFSISWVCRLWRQTALNTQGMWNYIDCRQPQLIQLCLNRSPSLELEVQYLCLDPSNLSRELLDLVMPELDRTSVLSLKGSIPPTTLYLEDFTLNRAPKLRSLSLDGFQLPESTRMFTGLPPPLRFLSLSNCSFQWELEPLIFGPGLTTLSITSPRSPMSFIGFMNTLRVMPRLRTLCLSDAFARVADLLLTPPPSPPHLPDLTLLKVTESSTAICSLILLGFTFTSKTVVVLCLYDNIAWGAEVFAALLLALITRTKDSPWNIDTVSIGHGQSSEVRLLSEQHLDWTTTKKTMARITIDSCTMDAAQILHSLRPLNRDALETVILNTASLDVVITAGIWQETLGNLPSLTKLKLRHGYANSFIDYLAQEGRLISQNMSVAISPLLTEEYILDRITFKGLKVLEIVRFSEYSARTTFLDFMLAMSLRVLCNLQLVAMAFANCRFREFNMMTLRGVLRRVHICSEWELLVDDIDRFTFPPSSFFASWLSEP
ncbi:hypothetical protein BDN72DRAFT_845657 [Pluteus cervinus]|uniref:Uncharacterized protein n=1 Tax=Pluteus cervinus TaxID=181527 RepID=A0ACD3AI21_9AGAR|nr:hypothetical protein BDN72DRAFT_845657 [Pluteus cervinus]